MRPLVVLDLDGTIVDSKLDLAESANEMLASYGAQPLPVDQVAGMVGEGAGRLVLRALVRAGVRADLQTALDRFLQVYGSRLLVHTRPYGGMPEALAAIAPHAALALLTNKPEQLSRRLLEAFHLAPFFFMLIGGDSGFPRKPDPAGLLALVDAAGAAPRSTLLVGDSTIDQQTAGAGGVNFCLAGYGFGRLREAISLGKDDLLAEESGHLAAVVLGFLSRLETSGS